MYLITIPVTRKFDAAKALADALEYGRLNEPAKSWTVVGMAVSASDARIMAQAVANDRNSVVEIRLAVISSGNHYGYTEIKPEPKPEPKPADEPAITGSDIEWEPYDGVPADTTGFPTTEELLARDTF